MADRTPAPDTPELRARWSASERVFKLFVALVMIALMVVVAKAAQFAAVDALGEQLGFDLASFVGLAPVIAFYFFLSVRYPHLNKLGLTRG
jgi:hypothetical protein